MVGLAAAGLLTGCSQEDQDQIARLALPEPASDRAVEIGELWNGAWLAAGIIGVFVWGLIIWAVVRYRRRDDEQVPVQNRYNLPIEVLYSVAPLIVIAVLFYYTVVVQREVLQGCGSNPDYAGSSVEGASAAAGEGHQVQVVAQKWAWTFSYLDEPALGGETDVFDIGNPEEFTELYLPVGEEVTFTLLSPDVVHSFFIPEFYFKLDVIPGKENCFTATPTREGTFVGRCTEFCGTYHPRMLFDVHIVSPQEYEQHLRDLEAAGQIGAPTGADYSYTAAGTDEEGEDR
jgi:cytochrome c oxidase subunit 2